MWVFWIIALLPIAIGAFLWYQDKEIVLWEWLVGSAVALLTAGIMQYAAAKGVTADVETHSGEITKVSYHPRWVERWIESHSRSYECGTSKNPKTCTEHWTTTEYNTHREHWVAHRNFGKYSDTTEIDYQTFVAIKKKFGNRVIDDGTQSYDHNGTRDSGDNHIYSTPNDTRVIYPVTTTASFENRIKAAPSLFSFTKVPTNINVYPWPANRDWMSSERVMGSALALVDTYKWDCLNSYVGPRKKVNVIIVGFGDKGSEYGHWQQAKWIGGKKNDLVITFGGGSKTEPAQWVYVFGWTEKEIVKKNIQSLLLTKPINDSLLPFISQEIANNYVIKDWTKFEYISIEPPTWSYWVFALILVVTQTGLYIFFHMNNVGKSGFSSNSFRTYRRSGFPSGCSKWN